MQDTMFLGALADEQCGWTGIARNTFAVFMQPHWDEVLELPGWADEDAVYEAGGLKGWVPGCTFGSFTTRTLAYYH